jgi:hypothetical protein
MRKCHVWAVVPLLATGAVIVAGGPTQAAEVNKTYTASLSGEKEVPGPGDANGSGDFAAITTKKTLCYSLSAKKIDKATMSHIHIGGVDIAGPIAVTLKTAKKGGVSDCITAVPDAEDTTLTLSESELAGIKADPSGYYVNVHNEPFPSGAVRGQLSS